MYTQIQRCRICDNEKLVEIVDLGQQCLTGAFPRSRQQALTHGPLQLVKCAGGAQACGLVQLRHSYEPRELYGEAYGYRSSLNDSMSAHLRDKVAKVMSLCELRDGDLIIDIGSNDGTLLHAYPPGRFRLIGVDPTGHKFRDCYPSHIELLPQFFSRELIRAHVGDRQARVITSIAMFYDVERPLEFMKEIHDLLDKDGIWMFEQSYLPGMLAAGSYDTICHEHLEYYSLKQIKWMTDRAGLRIVDVELNEVNGGSFCVTAARAASRHPTAADLDRLLAEEAALQLECPIPYRTFASRVEQSRSALRSFLAGARRDNKKVYGIGASTKGNVVLQYCGIDESSLPMIGEVNRDKINSYTPGTYIPIVWEDELLAMQSDYLLVLPWHYKDFFRSNPKFKGRTLVFPLPRLEIVRVP